MKSKRLPRSPAVRGAGAVALLAMALVGCAAETDAMLTPTAEEAPAEKPATPKETGPVEQDAPGIVLPDTCEAALPLATVHTYDNRLEQLSEGADAEAVLGALLGPVTMSALRGGAQQVYCGWGIRQTDASAMLGVAVIGEQEKAELLGALRDSTFEEVEAVGGAEAMFVLGQSDAHRYMDEIVLGGGLLVAASHTISGDFARDAFVALQG